MSRSTRPLVVLACALLVACSATYWSRIVSEPYELDEVSRTASVSAGADGCHPEVMKLYRGVRVRLEPPVTLAPPFEDRVARFENLVAEVGVRVYGRAPSRILNAGAYACRTVEHRKERLSEHALGNALDVTGFRFPALDRAANAAGVTGVAEVSLPRPLERGFTITVARAGAAPGSKEDAVTKKHREFFEQLREALRTARIFRGMLGPSDPQHATHLHLDMGPWSFDRL